MKIDCASGAVSAALDEAPGARALLILGHGAGGDMNDPVLAAVAGALSTGGISVLRFNFPYREAGRRAPGAQSASEQCYREVADAVRSDDVPLYLGGKSYGGRMATHIVADGYPAAGLVLLSYPLHPPGRFDKVRDEHLPRISVPMLFVQGTKDTFARSDLLEATLGRLPKATHVALDGGDHGLKVARRKREDVAREIAHAILAFVR